jgi:hypothetical protein
VRASLAIEAGFCQGGFWDLAIKAGVVELDSGLSCQGALEFLKQSKVNQLHFGSRFCSWLLWRQSCHRARSPRSVGASRAG